MAVMQSSEDPSEKIANQILLDIKAFMIIQESEVKAKHTIQRLILEAHDEYVNRFLRLAGGEKKSSKTSHIIVAVGELILSSFLILGGLVLLAPFIANLSTPSQLYGYLSQVLLYLTSNGPLFPSARIIGFSLAALLLVSAMYTLRMASSSIKEAGLLVHSGAE